MPSSGVFLCLDEGVLFGTGRIWRFHQCNKAYLDPLSSITNLVIEVRSHTRNCLELVSTTVKMTGVLCAPQIEGYCEITTPYLSAVELLPTQIIFIDCTINKIRISAVVLSTELFQP